MAAPSVKVTAFTLQLCHELYKLDIFCSRRAIKDFEVRRRFCVLEEVSPKRCSKWALWVSELSETFRVKL
jgi:hypothetical protein